VKVILPTAGLYLAAAVWYALRARKKVLPVAPEEVAARIAEELARKQGVAEPKSAASGAEAAGLPARPLYSQQMQTILERVAGPALAIGILSLVWMILRARGAVRGVFSEPAEVVAVTLLWGFLFTLVSAIGLMSTRNHGR